MMLLGELGYKKFKPVQQAALQGSTIRIKTLDGKELEHVFEQDTSGPFGEDIPQPWLGFEDTLREYEGIFRRYRRFGENYSFSSSRCPLRFKKAIRGSYRICTGYWGPLPGWYDIHASL